MKLSHQQRCTVSLDFLHTSYTCCKRSVCNDIEETPALDNYG